MSNAETASPAGHRRAGFSMVEVIIAMVILAIGVLGLAGTTAYIIRNVSYGDLMTERAAAFQTVVDRVQSLPFDQVGSGSDSVGVFWVTWTSVLDGPQNKIVTIVTTGPGVGVTNFPTNQPQRVDSFEFRVLRR
jgi:prepilin-type N-terminal cleavage/methylation domain-containing protein